MDQHLRRTPALSCPAALHFRLHLSYAGKVACVHSSGWPVESEWVTLATLATYPFVHLTYLDPVAAAGR